MSEQGWAGLKRSTAAGVLHAGPGCHERSRQLRSLEEAREAKHSGRDVQREQWPCKRIMDTDIARSSPDAVSTLAALTHTAAGLSGVGCRLQQAGALISEAGWELSCDVGEAAASTSPSTSIRLQLRFGFNFNSASTSTSASTPIRMEGLVVRPTLAQDRPASRAGDQLGAPPGFYRRQSSVSQQPTPSHTSSEESRNKYQLQRGILRSFPSIEG
ncbi:hypothetical protein JHW43_004843 [Diplocarpon mali]|nr:hypothetical protein JHW43_004843 [Diplocarpon mali]